MTAKTLKQQFDDLAAAMQSAAAASSARREAIERETAELGQRYEAAEAARAQEETKDLDEMDAALLTFIERLGL